MPFPDEVGAGGVQVVPSRAGWTAEGTALAARLGALLPSAVRVHHVGSTAVPGLAAKDCLDMMVVVEDLEGSGVERLLGGAGYRRRPEPWNLAEEADGRMWPKMVFAPPVGTRAANVHVRTVDSGSARLALLFRDHLRAVPERAARWGELKIAAASVSADLAAYGRLKVPAWRLLMELAEGWAADSGWVPDLGRRAAP